MAREIKIYFQLKWGTPLLQKKHYFAQTLQIHYLASALLFQGTVLFFLYTYVAHLSDNKINGSKYYCSIINQSAASSSSLLLTYATSTPDVTKTSIFPHLQPEEVPVFQPKTWFFHHSCTNMSYSELPNSISILLSIKEILSDKEGYPPTEYPVFFSIFI